MALDYSERRQVSKNRSRRNPVRYIVILALGSFCMFYGLGLLTGWLIFRSSANSGSPPPSSSVTDKTKGKNAVEPTGSKQSNQTNTSNNSVPLTFYNTLPKGEKGVIGSGLNPGKQDTLEQRKNDNHLATDSVQKPQKQNSDKHALQDKRSVNEKSVLEKKMAVESDKTSAEKASNEPVIRKADSGKPGYSVQVASSNEKKDAEELKSKLERNGFAARVVESRIPGKGVFYRVRVGNRLDQDAARQLASQVGKNAIVVPE